LPSDRTSLVLRVHRRGGLRCSLTNRTRAPRYYPWLERDAATVRAWIGRLIACQSDEPRDVFQLAIALPEGN
jgi:hypothetical protein